MYSSEKVLQMSYANYQCVHPSHLVVASDPDLVPQGQGGARRKVQELVHHGRARGLAPEDLLLARVGAGHARAVPGADAPPPQGPRRAQPWRAVRARPTASGAPPRSRCWSRRPARRDGPCPRRARGGRVPRAVQAPGAAVRHGVGASTSPTPSLLGRCTPPPVAWHPFTCPINRKRNKEHSPPIIDILPLPPPSCKCPCINTTYSTFISKNPPLTLTRPRITTALNLRSPPTKPGPARMYPVARQSRPLSATLIYRLTCFYHILCAFNFFRFCCAGASTASPALFRVVVYHRSMLTFFVPPADVSCLVGTRSFETVV